MMKRIGTAAALLVLVACNPPSATANGSGNGGQAAGNAASGASNPAPAGASTGAPTLDRAFLIGRWTDNGDCSNSTEFSQSGQFQTSSGAGGLWTLAGDQLTLTGSQTMRMQIVVIDQNTINIVNPDGSVGRSTRC